MLQKSITFLFDKTLNFSIMFSFIYDFFNSYSISSLTITVSRSFFFFQSNFHKSVQVHKYVLQDGF